MEPLPTPQRVDSPDSSLNATTVSTMPTDSTLKPTILHLGDDIRWNHDLYTKLFWHFNIIRTHSLNRESFQSALQEKTWGDFVAMYRPFWNTGGEMGNWDAELMYPLSTPYKSTT